jgi:hypothetical protein
VSLAIRRGKFIGVLARATPARVRSRRAKGRQQQRETARRSRHWLPAAGATILPHLRVPGRGASRPARAAWLVQRLLTADGDVAGGAGFRFGVIRFAADVGARAIAAAPLSYRVIAELRHRKRGAIGVRNAAPSGEVALTIVVGFQVPSRLRRSSSPL